MTNFIIDLHEHAVLNRPKNTTPKACNASAGKKSREKQTKVM